MRTDRIPLTVGVTGHRAIRPQDVPALTDGVKRALTELRERYPHCPLVMMVYDILRNDEECYRLLRYGFEGTQYVINSEGLMEKPSGYNADRDAIVTDFWWGRRDELELYDASFAWNDYKKLLEEYETGAIDYPWDGIAFYSPELEERIEEIVAVCDKYIPEIAYGRYDGSPDDEVSSFRAALKQAGFEEVTEELQKILNTY